MRLRCVCLVVFALAVVWAAAAQQVGTVTASGPFKLRGVEVPATAAQAVPVMSGNEIETMADTAVLVLEDGSRVTFDKNSAGQVVRRDGETMVCLGRGALRFSVAAGSRLVICALERTILPSAPSEGTITIASEDKVEAVAEKGTVRVDEEKPCSCEPGVGLPAAAGWSAKKKAIVIVVIGAAAGGTAAGIAAAGEAPPPPSVSP